MDRQADCCGIEGEDGGGGDSRSVAPAASAEAMAVLLEENCRLKEALEELKWSVLPAELQEDGRRGSGEASAGGAAGRREGGHGGGKGKGRC